MCVCVCVCVHSKIFFHCSTFQVEVHKLCPSESQISADMIFSDITGLKLMKRTNWYKVVELRTR